MKEKDLDNLERLFKEGLQHMESEPDDAVWQAVQIGVKKSKRFWKFWGIAGMVVIGLVCLMLFQNSEDAQDKTLTSNTPNTELTQTPAASSTPNENMNSTTKAKNDPAAASSTLTSPDVLQTPSNTKNTPSTDPLQPEETPARHADIVPNKNTKTYTKAPITPKANGTNNLSNPPPTGEVPFDKTNTKPTPPSLRTPTGSATNDGIPTHGESNFIPPLLYIAPQTFPAFECSLVGLPLNTIADMPIKTSDRNNENGDSPKNAAFILSFGAGTMIPSIQSKGASGNENFTKENAAVFGSSLNLGITYLSTKSWLFRSGLEWTAYANKGSMDYTRIDTLEWINRQRETGNEVATSSYKNNYLLKYRWISIPLEIGRIYPLTPQFRWEWTAGVGISYLYKYETMYSGLAGLGASKESYNRLQASIRLGFAINYQLTNQLGLSLSTRYQYQPVPVFKDALLSEWHQGLAFRFGIQYTLKSKGK